MYMLKRGHLHIKLGNKGHCTVLYLQKNLKGQHVKKQDCPVKYRTDGHRKYKTPITQIHIHTIKTWTLMQIREK